MPKPIRHLNQLTEQELLDAVKRMCAALNIPLSEGNTSLWRAVYEEYLKSKQDLLAGENHEPGN